NQGESLRSKTYWAQNREMMLKVLTHNIGIILLVKELFYRAYLTPLIPFNLRHIDNAKNVYMMVHKVKQDAQ
ncbi:MAG: hypothetical protein Q7T18_12295, partial [Sedimentisphaerales bacterium]|nr:hypothetical protein [Sedimentisphaerales bacterium]